MSYSDQGSNFKVAIWSLFRDDSDEYIDRYLARIDALEWPRENLRLYLVEGDSQDDTFGRLKAKTAREKYIKVIKHDTGLPQHGSVVHPQRFQALARPGNAVMDLVVKDSGDWADVGMLIESDLLYEPDLLQRLMAHRPDENAVIAPMIWIPRGNDLRFYDTWAFRRLGDHEPNAFFPHHNAAWFYAHYPNEPFEVWSVGSVVIWPMKALLAGARYSETFPECVIGICRQAAQLAGCKIYCDPGAHVLHPADWTSHVGQLRNEAVWA